jgi:hypothetical protein
MIHESKCQHARHTRPCTLAHPPDGASQPKTREEAFYTWGNLGVSNGAFLIIIAAITRPHESPTLQKKGEKKGQVLIEVAFDIDRLRGRGS